MGVALAEAAVQLGAQVDFVHGPIEITPPMRCRCHAVETALQMQSSLGALLAQEPDLLIMNAAVADFRPTSKRTGKVKKENFELEIKLDRNPDILLELCTRKCSNTKIVGFCVESGDDELLLSEARRKMNIKGCDAIVANRASEAIGTSTSRAMVLSRSNEGASREPLILGPASKSSLAHSVLVALVDSLYLTGEVSGASAR
jgi:phosphopantothenoylcysteine decarboxylase/phosphopantothenate--cysteine ligase